MTRPPPRHALTAGAVSALLLAAGAPAALASTQDDTAAEAVVASATTPGQAAADSDAPDAASTSEATTSPDATSSDATSSAPADGESSTQLSVDTMHTYTEAVSEYVKSVTVEPWEANRIAVADDAVALWDDRQRAMIDDEIADLEADGWTVRIAIVPSFPYDFDLDMDSGTARLGMQRSLTEIARDSPHEKTVYVLASRSSTMFSVYENGRLRTELRQIYPDSPPYINTEQTGPEISYALRTLALDEDATALTPEEEAPVGWTGIRYRGSTMQNGEIGAAIMKASFYAGAAVGAVMLLLCFLLLLPRSTGPLARLFGTRLDRQHETAALAALRDDAVRAHRKLTRAAQLSSSLETAIGRIPDPEETSSPLVWAGWTALAREHDGQERGQCFFRPDLPADREESVDILGAQVTVPVSDLAAERIAKGRAPSYLSLSGIDRGQPYWRRAASPWAASGYGAFGPLSEAIASMPADWRPSPGAERVERAFANGAHRPAVGAAGASPWARAGLLLIAAFIALASGIAGGLHDGKQLEKTYTAQVGAPGSPVADVDAARQQYAERVLAAAEDGPHIDLYSRIQFLDMGLADVQEAADEASEASGLDIRVLALSPSYDGVITALELEDALGRALPENTIAVLIDRYGATLVTGALEPDYMDSPRRPEYDPDATPTDRAVNEIRWAQEASWVVDDDATDDDDEAEAFEPAPGTAGWLDRLWVRTLMGASGAALLVLVAGIVFRGVVTERTEPDPVTTRGGGKQRSRGQKKSSGKTGSGGRKSADGTKADDKKSDGKGKGSITRRGSDAPRGKRRKQ